MTEPATTTKTRGPGRPGRGDRREVHPTRLLLTLDRGMAEEIDVIRDELALPGGIRPSRQDVILAALYGHLSEVRRRRARSKNYPTSS